MIDNDLGLALERLVAERKRIGPPPTLRQAVWAIPITTPAERRWLPRFDTGGFTMFSALKFIAAGVIVALFGGFLLMGVLSTPQGDDVLPAAVTESPSPTTTEELLSGMVTEEVEPGVYKILNDGVRALGHASGRYSRALVDVTPDGGVWLSSDEGRHGLFRLGEERVFEDRMGGQPFKEVAPDGSLWVIDLRSDDREGIRSFDGEEWKLRATTTDRLWGPAIGSDGTVWAAAEDEDKYCPDIEDDDCSGTVLLRLEDDGSLTTIEDWSDVYDGDAYPHKLAVSPDGDAWLVGGETKDGTKVVGALLRFDGESWEAIPGPEGWALGRHLDVGPDGTLWVDASREVGEWNRGDLARYDDAGWTTFTDADGVEPWGDMAWAWAFMDMPTVAADGSLWLQGIETRTDDNDCGGAAHYDGTTWTSYLGDSCIEDLAIAPDGSVWLRANSGLWVATYVITPEAVAATE